MPELIDSQSALPSRRAVIGAAAWSVPVIAVLTATPAFASSPPPATAKLVWNNLSVWQFDGHRAGGNFGLRIDHPGITAMASVTLHLKDSAGKVKATLNVGPYVLATDKNDVQFVFSRKLPPNQTYTVDGIISGTLTSWRDDQLGKTYTGTWSLDSVPSGAVQVAITP